MAKIRAYKLAEELGLEKEEFLEKAGQLGIELRSAMVGVDEDEAAVLRDKFGPRSVETIEKRVGSGVIRRRRKVLPKPAPAPEPVEAPAAVVSEPLAPGEPGAPPATEPAPLAAESATASDSATAPRMTQPAVVVEDPLLAHEAARAEAAPVATPEPALPESAPAAPRPASEEVSERDGGRRTPSQEPASAAARRVRRVVREGQNLKEQDTLARQARGNVQAHLERRRLIVDQQSRLQSGHHTRQQPKRKLALSTAPPKEKIVRLGATISFPELSRQTGEKVRDLLRRARALDVELERDDMLEVETAGLLAEELGYTVLRVESEGEKAAAAVQAAAETPESLLEPRPPVVTVMGHVDHGKTSLLDTIRQSNVVATEAGGITQHVGAYQVEKDGAKITFIDTPGHAAFTQMRARGARVTDLVVLVVAADDGVMPQTVEAINHAKAAEVPIIVAVNKIDLPDANPQRVKQALLEHELVPEEFGGETICVEVSATVGTGIDKLLEMLALQAEVLELKARAVGPARAVVVEAQLDRQRGPVATLLVKEGVLERGDAVVVGNVHGRVRTLEDDQGQPLKQASPATPVRVIGLSGVPEAGQELVVVVNEREAKKVVEHRLDEERRAGAGAPGVAQLSAEEIFASLEDDETHELLVVVKADVRGTLEAICEALENLSTDRVALRVLHSGIGGITESDVMLASASNAQVIGFHVRPEAAALKAAERESVEIRTADVVYELVDSVRAVMEGLLPPKQLEQVTGHAEVRQIFTIPRLGTIAGCYVTDGPVRRSDLLRIVRDGVSIYSSRVGSLRRVKDDVREVVAGLECGILVENFNDVKVGDVLETYVIEETPDTL